MGVFSKVWAVLKVYVCNNATIYNYVDLSIVIAIVTYDICMYIKRIINWNLVILWRSYQDLNLDCWIQSPMCHSILIANSLKYIKQLVKITHK